ncbi:MAG: hypothetical protein ACRC26_09415, partial [Bacteroidales bacterium]
MMKMKNLTKTILVNSINPAVTGNSGDNPSADSKDLQHPVRRLIKSPWVTTILGVIYILSPIDLLPDIPV